MENKKYKLTNESKTVYGRKLYRIQALRDFSNVREGELGGFVEAECNLSHKGNAWVYENARVYGDAQVFGNARVSGNARVFGNARVYLGECIETCSEVNELYQFNMTLYNNYIRVGCKTHDKDEWKELLKDEDLYLDLCKDKESQQKMRKFLTFILEEETCD